MGRLAGMSLLRRNWRSRILTHICCVCKHLIQEGQRVNVEITATYHVLKSSVSYALYKTDIEAHSDTLCHAVAKECLADEDFTS